LRAPKLHLQKVDVVNLMSHERFSSKSWFDCAVWLPMLGI
jgi:hypothetical protein